MQQPRLSSPAPRVALSLTLVSCPMLELLKSLSELNSLQSMPWRWWVSFALGMGGMIAILMNVERDIAVLYIFINLILAIVLATAWEWHADAKKHKSSGSKSKANS
ncbi:MAG: hypothetical protein ABIR16_06295 [Dokdonella sp.]